MVALEKAGLPSLAIAVRSFARAYQSCEDGWGQPTSPFVAIAHATTARDTT